MRNSKIYVYVSPTYEGNSFMFLQPVHHEYYDQTDVLFK